MTRVLILSSYVAASRVGGAAQALALARLGVEPILVPTCLFGRHPGHGPPGGGPVAAGTMDAMLGAIEAQGLLGELDAMITGYFASVDQVAVAATTIDKVRAARPATKIVVDPIMGDVGKGLYVQAAVADAITETLVPRADMVTPNAWELARLSGLAVTDGPSALAAARALGGAILVSSIETREGLGVAYVDQTGAWIAAHHAAPATPNGTGDLLTALFVAAALQDFEAPNALYVATSGAVEAAFAADGAAELALESLPTALELSPRVRIEALDG